MLKGVSCHIYLWPRTELARECPGRVRGADHNAFIQSNDFKVKGRIILFEQEKTTLVRWV